MESLASRTSSAALQLRFVQNDKPFGLTHYLCSRETFTGICCDFVLSSRMFRGALVLALGLFTVCFSLAAQQTRHAGPAQHRVNTSAVTPFDSVSNLSIYRPNVMKGSDSILFHKGPVRAWSDGAQLINESALVQIGMAPLGLFPAAYLAPNEVGPTRIMKSTARSDPRSANLAADGKDLSSEMLSSPLNHVYYTGEI